MTLDKSHHLSGLSFLISKMGDNLPYGVVVRTEFMGMLASSKGLINAVSRLYSFAQHFVSVCRRSLRTSERQLHEGSLLSLDFRGGPGLREAKSDGQPGPVEQIQAYATM